MKLNYSILVAFVALLWVIVKQFVPELPVDEVTFNGVVLAFLLYVLAKLGVEVVEAYVARFLRRVFRS
jgi:small basic protein